jgi:TadE-like protein
MAIFKNSSGASLLETALIFPIFIYFGLAIIDVANYYHLKNSLIQAADEGLRCLFPIDGECREEVNSSVPIFDVYEVSTKRRSSIPLVKPEVRVNALVIDTFNFSSAKTTLLDSVEYNILEKDTGNFKASFDFNYLHSEQPVVSYSPSGYNLRFLDGGEPEPLLEIKRDIEFTNSNPQVALPINLGANPYNRSDLGVGCFRNPIRKNTFQIPESCEIDPLANEAKVMMLIEGESRSLSSKGKGDLGAIDISFENIANKTIIDLGGVEFALNSNTTFSKTDFAPRGAFKKWLNLSELPQWQETDKYENSLKLRYNTSYRLNFRLRDNSSPHTLWRLKSIRLFTHQFKTKQVKEIECLNLLEAPKNILELCKSRPTLSSVLQRNDSFNFIKWHYKEKVDSALGTEETKIKKIVASCLNAKKSIKKSWLELLGRKNSNTIQLMSLCPPVHRNEEIEVGSLKWQHVDFELNSDNLPSVFPFEVERDDCLESFPAKDKIPTVLRSIEDLTLTPEKVIKSRLWSPKAQNKKLTYFELKARKELSCLRTVNYDSTLGGSFFNFNTDKLAQPVKHPGCGCIDVRNLFNPSLPNYIDVGDNCYPELLKVGSLDVEECNETTSSCNINVCENVFEKSNSRLLLRGVAGRDAKNLTACREKKCELKLSGYLNTSLPNGGNNLITAEKKTQKMLTANLGSKNLFKIDIEKVKTSSSTVDYSINLESKLKLLTAFGREINLKILRRRETEESTIF